MPKLIKRDRGNYTNISNIVVRDSRLSWKARGIFLYLWSQANEWQFYVSEVATHATDGESALRSGLKDTFATKVQLNTSITQTSTQIMTEVNKKVDEEELGTKIIQDYESVQVAWNKISDFIKMMVFMRRYFMLVLAWGLCLSLLALVWRLRLY